jgi:chromosomal replication initiator protein
VTRSGGAHDVVPAAPGTFAAFVVGGGNRLAYAAAKSVAENPSGDYNPVLLHGRAGLGKTHLLSAIQAHVAGARGGAGVVRAPAEALLRDLLRDPHASLRAHGRPVDLLLVDDLHEVVAWGPPPPEVLRAVERLLDASPQVVVTAEGLVVELEPPDAETRGAILRVLLRGRGVDPTPDLVEDLAARAFESVGDLELVADEVARLSAAGPVTADDLARAVGGRLPARPARPAAGRLRRGAGSVRGEPAAGPRAAAAPAGTDAAAAAPFDDPGEVFLEWMPLEDRLVEWRG